MLPAVEGSGYSPLFSTYEAAPGEPCSGLGSEVLWSDYSGGPLRWLRAGECEEKLRAGLVQPREDKALEEI